ncbi:MAG TPA: 50S ribosomal protein L3 [Lentisphaeria bacterium]|nr:50S ribosomal protein L3 [Lentisphaeria bacterium]
MKGLIGKKIGMTQVWDESGKFIPVTVIEVGPCTVIAHRTEERDGYSAVQLGYGIRKLSNVSKAVRNHIAAANYDDHAPMWIRELRTPANPDAEVGSQLLADVFATGEFVDVTGTMKGRGFQGVVKRYRFGGGRASHGGGWTRRPGSIGMCVNPGKVYKGRKMPGQMGNVKRTVQNLQVVQVRKDDNVILVKGSIPGPNGQCVVVRQAKKK